MSQPGEGEVVVCDKSYSQGAGLTIRIRVPAGPAFLQSRDHLVSGGLMMGFCGSLEVIEL